MEAIETKPKRTYQKHKTEYKITVKHYLNTKLKPEVTSDGRNVYPIYTVILAKRQNHYRRSLTFAYSTIDDFEELLIREKSLFDAEKELLTNKIRKHFDEGNEDLVGAFVSLLNLHVSLAQRVRGTLNYEIIKEAERYFSETLHKPFKPLKELLNWIKQEPTKLFDGLISLVPTLEKVQNQYTQLFYFQDFLNVLLNRSQLTKDDFTIFDVQAGYFQKEVRKNMGEKSSDVLRQLNILLEQDIYPK
ncbi:MAG: hypothetical protein U0Y10_04340 [Spirosomataceae bacterium]